MSYLACHRPEYYSGPIRPVCAIRDGEIKESEILELGNVISNPELGRTSEEQITIADLTGIAIQDIQIAKMVDRALDAS